MRGTLDFLWCCVGYHIQKSKDHWSFSVHWFLVCSVSGATKWSLHAWSPPACSDKLWMVSNFSLWLPVHPFHFTKAFVRDACCFSPIQHSSAFFRRDCIRFQVGPTSYLLSVHIFGRDFPFPLPPRVEMWTWIQSQHFIPEAPKVVGSEIHITWDSSPGWPS